MIELWLESFGLLLLGGLGLADAGMQLCGGFQLNSIVACVAVMCLMLGVPLCLWVHFIIVMWLIGSDGFFGLVTCRCCRSHSGPQYTSDSVPHEVDFLHVGAGKLGMCISPGRKKGRWDRSLNADLERIQSTYRSDVIVTLLTEQDIQDIQVPALLDSIRSRGIASIHFPIRDKFIPSDIERFTQLIHTIVQMLHRGKTVVVHCNGGKGRTGLVVVATLIAYHGYTVAQAMETVRASRAGTLYNPLQILYAHQFASYWHENLTQNTLPLALEIQH